MNDEYLWNRTGRDPEVEQLEELLAPLRHGARGAAPLPPPARPKLRPLHAVLALAASVAIAFTIRAWSGASDPMRETASAPREIDLDTYGSVSVHAGAVVEVVRQTADDIRLRLERGTIDARISTAARPRLFKVETPATTCVDLGCQYTLTVAEDRSTFVRVHLGQVAFVDGRRETWIPSGASCRAWPARGSGTPRWDDARPELAAAIEAMDLAQASARSAAAREVIQLCREVADALTLWHLAHDEDRALSGAAWKALGDLTAGPEGVAALRAPEAAEAWKQHLESLWQASGVRR